MSKETGPIVRASEIGGGTILAVAGIIKLLRATPTLPHVVIGLALAGAGLVLVTEGLR